MSKSIPGKPLILPSAFQQRNRRSTSISTVRLCLLRTAPIYRGAGGEGGGGSESDWHESSKLRKQKPEPRSDSPSTKELAGTTWCTDTVTLKRLYTGRIKPVLEYGMTARGTTAKSSFDRVNKVQNWATCKITGAMMSTPIVEFETVIELHSLEDHREYKLQTQAAKFKRLQDHPMRQRLPQPTKGRLKRGSFFYQSRTLKRRHRGILDHDDSKEIPRCLVVPTWGEGIPSPQPPLSVPSPVLVGKTPTMTLRESPSLRNTFKTITQRSPGFMSTPPALLRMKSRMEGQESTSSTQEAETTESASPPAYTLQTTKLKQKPLKQQQPTLKSALKLPTMLPSLQALCPSCRHYSQRGTLTTMIHPLLLPSFAETMQSPCRGLPPKAM